MEEIFNVELKLFNLRFDAVSLFSLGSTQLTGSDTLTCLSTNICIQSSSYQGKFEPKESKTSSS